MKFLTEHPYFSYEAENSWEKTYHFINNKYKFVIIIPNEVMKAIDYGSLEPHIHKEENWCKELYAKTLLWDIERKKTRILLSEDTYQKERLVGIYLLADSIFKKDIS